MTRRLIKGVEIGEDACRLLLAGRIFLIIGEVQRPLTTGEDGVFRRDSWKTAVPGRMDENDPKAAVTWLCMDGQSQNYSSSESPLHLNGTAATQSSTAYPMPSTAQIVHALLEAVLVTRPQPCIEPSGRTLTTLCWR